MTFTSVVDSELNPFPGKIFTSPADNTDGDWAHYGCFEHVDYSGFNEITKDVFLGVLTGDKERVQKATGKENPKVLNSGPNDTVFAYYLDHGNVNVISVGWDYVQDYQLLEAIQTAHSKQLYGKWFWLFDSCYAGSMFRDFPSDLNFYVASGADDKHEALMSNCPPDDDIVAGKELGTCLSVLFEDSFLGYLDSHPDCTLGEIVDFTKKDVAKTSKQNISEFGDLQMRELRVSEFMGTVKGSSTKHKNPSKGVTYSEVPTHLAKWKAIRGAEEAMEEYRKKVFDDARVEIESLRMGRLILSENQLDKALRDEEGDSTDCVAELALEYARHCKHQIPLSKVTMSVIRSMCKTGLDHTAIDFDEVCIF